MVPIRIKESVLEAIDKAAKRAGLNRSKYILLKVEQADQVTQYAADVEAAYILSGHPIHPIAGDLLKNRYTRPAHSPSCHCYVCQPPK